MKKADIHLLEVHPPKLHVTLRKPQIFHIKRGDKSPRIQTDLCIYNFVFLISSPISPTGPQIYLGNQYKSLFYPA